jgi:hypothetical protein
MRSGINKNDRTKDGRSIDGTKFLERRTVETIAAPPIIHHTDRL